MNFFNLVDKSRLKGKEPTPFDYWVTKLYLKFKSKKKKRKCCGKKKQ